MGNSPSSQSTVVPGVFGSPWVPLSIKESPHLLVEKYLGQWALHFCGEGGLVGGSVEPALLGRRSGTVSDLL